MQRRTSLRGDVQPCEVHEDRALHPLRSILTLPVKELKRTRRASSRARLVLRIRFPETLNPV